jgi:hypothetical protein
VQEIKENVEAGRPRARTRPHGDRRGTSRNRARGNRVERLEGALVR